MPGVHIEYGAAVASGSVVTKNVSHYTIIGGNSAQLIRERFEDDVIKTLLRLAWWGNCIDYSTCFSDTFC